MVCAILSSNVDIAIEAKTCFSAEVGLSGEIRPVPRIEQRIGEAEKLGYKRIFISKHSKGITQDQFKIKLVAVGKIEEVLKHLFG